MQGTYKNEWIDLVEHPEKLNKNQVIKLVKNCRREIESIMFLDISKFYKMKQIDFEKLKGYKLSKKKLKDVLLTIKKNPFLERQFENQLRLRHSIENWDFWNHVMRMIDIETYNTQNAFQSMKEVFEKFLVEDAIEEVKKKIKKK